MSKGRLKIGILCYPTYGGSGVVATEIGMAMARRGHQVHFISYEVPIRLERFLENVYFHEVEVADHPIFVYPPYDLALASKLVDVTSHIGLDLVHAHYAVPHATSAFLARQVLGRPSPAIVTTLHGTDITLVGSEQTYRPITRFSIMQSDCVTVPSQFLRDATFDRLDIPRTLGIEVIPNFVDTSRFCPARDDNCRRLISSLGGRQGERIMVHISNFRPVKRVLDVVRVFALVNTAVPSRLIMVGDGPERAACEDLVRELSLEAKVTFVGKQASIAEVLQAACLFIFPSENESFGLVALEAMSCGVPVIATSVGGIPEVVRHGETGYLSGVGEIEAMAANAVRLLGNADLHREFSLAGRARAVAHFESSCIIDRYEELYFSSLEGN